MARLPRPRPRTASRVAAVQALFQSEQTGESAEAVIEQFVRHRLGALPDATDDEEGYAQGRVPHARVALFGQIVRQAVQGQDVIDRLLIETLPREWPLSRLDPVLRAVLRAGCAELTMPDGPPGKVVINEYVDVARGFFTGDEPRMANGVLDRLAHRLRAAEFEDAGQREDGAS